MGTYLNPGYAGFSEILKSEYVDKTGLIQLINTSVGTKKKLPCVSRPRRFGKSFAAQMLCAYYDCSCDSHVLFDGLQIAKTDTYHEHMNHYNVVCFDVTSFISVARRSRKPMSDVPNMIVDSLKKELTELYSYLKEEATLIDCFLCCTEREGKAFVFIIDVSGSLYSI